MSRGILKISFLVITILVIHSCKKGHRLDCFKGNGEEVTETRYLGNFNRFAVYNKIDVEVVQGSECKIEVTAGKNILHGILTKVSNDSLLIENQNSCNFVRGYKKKIKVRLTMPYVKRMFNWGVGSITFDNNFKQDTFLFARAENSGDSYLHGAFDQVSTSSHGNGDMTVSGTARDYFVYTNGTNFTHAENLLVKNLVYVSSYSIGDVFLNLNGVKEFEYYIWSKGNIYYSGNPLKITNLGEGNADGTGKLIKLD